MFRTLLISLSAFVLNQGTFASERNVTYQYKPASSVVVGKLHEKTFYGPPGYGENPKTDRKETQYLLTLESPIEVQSDGTHGALKKVKSITLLADLKVIPKYVGKTVEVTGRFVPAETGHHHTSILMEVSKLTPLTKGE